MTSRQRSALKVAVALTGCLMLATSAIMIAGIRVGGGWSAAEWPSAEPVLQPAAISSRPVSTPLPTDTGASAAQDAKVPLSAKPRRTHKHTPTVAPTAKPTPQVQVQANPTFEPVLVGEPVESTASAGPPDGHRPVKDKKKRKKRHHGARPSTDPRRGAAAG
ncbi:hypothetical protein ACIBG8_51505 [Nonomuraea sp. NPDC050556]|uniref:hypothetical protein n=1 Tax=Nonomuraea sp. NPDC050556 TaxID=3364369 RepID=UPI0037A03A3A